MSYQEKRSIVSMLTAVIVLGAYWLYAYGKVQSNAVAADDMRFWAITMLVFIGIGIVVAVVIQLLFHILLSIAVAVREKSREGDGDEQERGSTIESDMVTDERDQLIELKSMRVSFIVVVIGFVSALVLLIIHPSMAVMLNILYGSFYIGSLAGSVIQLFYYKRGIRYG